MAEIYPGILAHTLDEYTTRLELVEESRAGWVHVDIMDGQFVPTISVMPHEIMGTPTKLKVEAHLMVLNPERYFSDLSAMTCNRVVVHLEAFDDVEACGKLIKRAQDYFPEVGLAVIASTPLQDFRGLGTASLQIMSVQPGQSGQVMLPGTVDRIKEAVSLNKGLTVSVDGGVTDENIKELQKAGARRFVVSSHLFAHNAVPQNFYYFTQLITGGAWER